MDFTEKRRVTSPELKANPVSKFLFIWLTPLLKKGTKKTLSIDDLYDRLPEDDSSTLGDKLQRLWEQECKRAKLHGRKPSFLRTSARFFGIKFFWFTFYVLVNELVLKLSQPFILRNMIRSFSSEKKDSAIDNNDGMDQKTQQYVYTAALITVTFLYAVNLHHIYMGLIHLAMKGRLACNSVIYRKIFRLSKTVQSEKVSIGKLVNLVGSDSSRFDHCFFHINMLIAGPAQLIILSVFLFMELGVACFIGLGIIIGFLIPFQVVVGRLSAKYRAEVAQRTDERGRMMSEIILGIRLIKMYAWEIPFSKVIHKLRKYEILPVKKASYLRGTFQSLNFLGKQTIPLCTFILYISMGNALTADKAYFTIAVYAIIIPAMAQKIPVAAAQSAELMVAIRRIEDFLLLEELKTQGREDITRPRLLSSNSITEKENGYDKHYDVSSSPVVPQVILKDVSANWSNDRVTLQNVSLNLTGNQLVMIVGPVGSGKSSLLNLIISELSILSGTMSIQGRLSYASQETWIFSGNLRQNILFGSLYDQTRYENVVRACGLEDDIMQFPNGDKTIVGERGVSLSGGQKARVSLARALYRKADIYLMDDPLSAVDSRIGRHIFENCMQQYYEGSLRILVTHQLQYLPQADYIVVFNENGTISAQGSYQELVAQKVDFVCNMHSNAGENDVDEDSNGDTDSSNILTPEDSKSTIVSKVIENKMKVIKVDGSSNADKEKMESGSVTWTTYFTYITSGNSKFEMVVVMLLFIFAQVVASFSDKWLSMWTNEVSRKSLKDRQTESQHSDETYITVYSACVGCVVVLVTSRALLYFHYAMSISVNLHDKMFSGLVRAPVRYFDKNSSGRIINRFTRDLNSIDEQLPPCLSETLHILLFFVGIMIVVISTNYYLIVPCILLMFVLWRIRNFYVKTARDIKRLDSISKSPIFLHLSATVQGLSTIRGLEAEQVVTDQFDSYLDINTSASYLNSVGNRWMGVWMDTMCVIYLACVASNFIIFSSDSEAGNVGMSITLTMNLLMITQWGMRQSAETENLMTSVERCVEYCNIKPEATLESAGPHKNWPNAGAIKFSNVSLAYNESGDPKILKNLNFEIKGNEKIGIVGRTGAGKSSILVALFRLTEPQGEILIDGIPTRSLGLHDLRGHISIIPQDPILFSGTMRYNLDPFDQFSDPQLWEVLKEVNLAEVVPSLDFKVSDGGGNFSVGQRQLVCLARAILRKNKIIVMDEATANVDPNTDNLIQREIRRKFSDCTIITIAHRLHSVIDNDRILVMDNGHIVEFDSPEKLLQNPNGLFSLMVNQAGSLAEMMNLRKIATG